MDETRVYLTPILNGRIVLHDGVPVPTTDQIPKSEVFLTPHHCYDVYRYEGGEVRLVEYPWAGQ